MRELLAIRAGSMPQYGTCECSSCYVRIPKPNAYRVTIERETGRSGGSYRFYSKSRSSSYSTGRRYYANKDIWLCPSCYSKYRSQQTRNAIATFALVGCAIVGVIWLGSGNRSQPNPTSTSVATAVSPEASSTPSVQLYHPMQPTISEALPFAKVVQIQTRLAQLGYLLPPFENYWGSKSLQAFRAFKAANGMIVSDSVDDETVATLFSGAAAYAPAPLSRPTASGGRESTPSDGHMQGPRNAQKPNDCRQAQTASARLICADEELAKLDSALGAALQNRKMRIASADRANLIREQIAWI